MCLEKLYIGGTLLLEAGTGTTLLLPAVGTTCAGSQDAPTAMSVERRAIAGASDLLTTADLAETDVQILRSIVISHYKHVRGFTIVSLIGHSRTHLGFDGHMVCLARSCTQMKKAFSCGISSLMAPFQELNRHHEAVIPRTTSKIGGV